jgi:DNA-binding GntR family transcriptional regulator
MNINTQSLREQIYLYLRDGMQTGELAPGATLNLNEISNKLGISKTPLRDALIQLEAEGFVSILPRRGVMVNKLTLEDVREYYEILGALEASVVLDVFHQITPDHIDRMKQLNRDQKAALAREDYENYYRLNLEFHGVFLDLGANKTMLRLITPLKQRLYDFPRQRYNVDWEKSNCAEHDLFIEFIEAGDREGAARFMKYRHWSYTFQEKHIRQFHGED